jgi:hypothetical protein
MDLCVYLSILRGLCTRYTYRTCEQFTLRDSDLPLDSIPKLSKSVRSRTNFSILTKYPPLSGVTNNVITSQVASGLLVGLFPQSKSEYIAAFIQSSSFDSLEPTYSCSAASNLRTNYTTGASGDQWKIHLSQAADLYAKLDKISGIATDDSAGWHSSFDQ